MKIQLISDLHLESGGFNLKLSDQADVLVIAGDAANFSFFSEYRKLLEGVTIPIVAVMGNHEFYADTRLQIGVHSMNEVKQMLKDAFKDMPNFHLLDNEVFCVGDFRFIGSTLWSGVNLCEPMDEFRVKFLIDRGINDFRFITDFSVNKMVELYRENFQFIQGNLNSEYRNIVVTHFPPHSSCVHSKYKGNLLNSYFVNNIEDDFFDPVELWLFGHTHSSFNHKVKNCRLICNPRGYRYDDMTENEEFKETLIIKI